MMVVSFWIIFSVIILIALVTFLLTMKKNPSYHRSLAIVFALIHWFCSNMKTMLNFYANILVRTSNSSESLSYQITEISQARVIFQSISVVSYILMWIFLILIICRYKKEKSLS